eukprot:2210-Heterococcus_DN1.PRE.8
MILAAHKRQRLQSRLLHAAITVASMHQQDHHLYSIALACLLHLVAVLDYVFELSSEPAGGPTKHSIDALLSPVPRNDRTAMYSTSRLCCTPSSTRHSCNAARYCEQ